MLPDPYKHSITSQPYQSIWTIHLLPPVKPFPSLPLFLHEFLITLSLSLRPTTSGGSSLTTFPLEATPKSAKNVQQNQQEVLPLGSPTQNILMWLQIFSNAFTNSKGHRKLQNVLGKTSYTQEISILCIIFSVYFIHDKKAVYILTFWIPNKL